MCLATRKCGQWKRALRAHEFDTSVAYEPVGAAEKMCTKSGGTDESCMRFAAMCKERHKAIYAISNSEDPAAIIQTFPEHLRNDREVVLAAVKQNGHALKFASPSMKKNEEVVLAAVQQNGLALQHALLSMKNNEKVVLAAVEQNGHALKFAWRRLKNDEEIALAAIRQNSNALEHVGKDFLIGSTPQQREALRAALIQGGPHF